MEGEGLSLSEDYGNLVRKCSDASSSTSKLVSASSNETNDNDGPETIEDITVKEEPIVVYVKTEEEESTIKEDPIAIDNEINNQHHNDHSSSVQGVSARSSSRSLRNRRRVQKKSGKGQALIDCATMPPKKPRRTKAPDPRRSPSPDEEERAAAAYPFLELEFEPEAEEAEEDAPAKRRVVTNFSEDEKELIIEFLQRNPTLYSKRLAGFKDTAAKDRLWMKQARQMNCTPNELKTWYDSMRTKLGKLKKDVTKSGGQAAYCFTPTEQWIWQRFQFLLEHIVRVPRRTVASFTTQPQPAAAARAPPAAPAPEALEDTPPAPPALPAGTPASTQTSSTAGTNPDLLMSLLETFLTERKSQTHPATAFCSYVEESLRSLPPAIRRTAEAKIMAALHECHNEADRQQFRPVHPQQPAPADRQRPRTWYGEPPAQRLAQRPARRPEEPPVRHCQSPSSQLLAEVTNLPDLWHSMDRPWVQEHFPEMNNTCPPPITGNQPQPHPSSSTHPPSTSAAEVQDIQMLAGSDPQQPYKPQPREKDKQH